MPPSINVDVDTYNWTTNLDGIAHFRPTDGTIGYSLKQLGFTSIQADLDTSIHATWEAANIANGIFHTPLKQTTSHRQTERPKPVPKA